MLPSGLLSVIGLFANIAMLISIHKRSGMMVSLYLILQWIGSINAIATLPIASYTIIRRPFLRGIVIEKSEATAFLTLILFLQLHVNLALTHDRYIAVKKPLQYRLESRLRQSKRWLILGLIPIVVLSCTISYLTSQLPSLKIHLVLVAGARASTFAAMSIIYYKLLTEYRKSNATIEGSSSASEMQTAASRIRRINERHMTYKFMGITISFVVLNLPIAVASNLFPDARGCDTKKGVLLSICIALDALNRVFDPVWYFLMERRNRSQRQKVQVSHSAVTQLQSKRNVKN